MEEFTNKETKKNTSKEYEKFISFVYQLSHSEQFENITIHTDVHLDKQGNFIRKNESIGQFDIYCQTESFGTITKYAIECKDHKKKVSKDKVRDFVLKMKDCKINKS